MVVLVDPFTLALACGYTKTTGRICLKRPNLESILGGVTARKVNM